MRPRGESRRLLLVGAGKREQFNGARFEESPALR